MYKVIIADDESIIRNSLNSAFIWEKHGMKVVGLAKNGIEALKLFEEKRPDICLLDIQMPLLNGIQLIKKINDIDKNSIKVIISGHDEFEYARKAIELGVYGYILKPIDEDSFADMLDNIKKQLDETRHRTEIQKQKDKILSEKRQLFCDELLGSWLSGDTPGSREGELSQETLEELGIRFSHTIGMVLVSVIYPVSILEDDRIKEYQISVCRERIEKRFSDDDSFCLIRLYSNCFVLLYNAEDKERWDNINQELKDIICDDNKWNISIHKKYIEGPYTELPKAFSYLNGQLNMEFQYMPIVKRLKEYIEVNYQNMQLRFSTFAEEKNISLSYLSKLFKKETGKTCIEYLIQYRIIKSLEFLSNTDLKICEISEKVGYSSQHYYCEAFKKVMGMAPSEYKRRKQ